MGILPILTNSSRSLLANNEFDLGFEAAVYSVVFTDRN